MPEAVIVAATRSPIGRAVKGSLASLRPDDMLASIISAVLKQVPELPLGQIEDVLVGCGQPAGESGYNIARVASLLAGLPDIPGVTVNRYCSSSLQTIRMAAHAIKAGEGDCFVAAGVETVSRFGVGRADGHENSRNPKFKAAMQRSSERSAGGTEGWSEAAGLPDIYIAMGQTAENVAEHENVSREEMDEFACRSQELAVQSQADGFFSREITPLSLADGSTVTQDDGPRPNTTVEKLASLKPVFRPGGSITAGNACPLNDGAAALIVMSDSKAKELGIQPLARFVASGVSALNPELMGLGPVAASRQALQRAGLKMEQIDRVEINEAFAAQVVPSAKHLGVPWSKLNTHGGAIALGHPFGMTGARIMTTLLNVLKTDDQRLGLETMCVGGGQGMAMIVERLS